MRKLPESLSDEGLLVGWSLEPGKRRQIIGFSGLDAADRSTANFLEPILDTGEGHLLTVAPTGAGKGTGCIIPALLRYRGPVVVVDPKGENYAVTSRRRREMGQEVILLDPFGITGAEASHRFNPLDLANPASDRYIEDVATLAGLIMSPQSGKSNDQFWVQMGKSLVTAAIIDVMTMDDSEDATFLGVRSLINSSYESLKKRAELWQTSRNPELARLASLLGNPADETFGGYWSFAIHLLDFLKGDQISHHLSASDLDLNKVLEGAPLSIYLALPPDKLESHAGLLRLWIGTIISVITRRKQRPEHSTLLLIDEAAQMGTLPQLKQAITLLRGYGVRVWTFWQDLSQLRNLYPYDWETILNNSRVQQYFGATTGLAAEAISQASGYRPPEAVLDLERDELILNISGDEPVIAGKPNYRRDPAFHGLFEANPFYLKAKPDHEESRLRTRPVYRKTSSPAVRQRDRNTRQVSILANRIFHPVSLRDWAIQAEMERLTALRRIGVTAADFLANPCIHVYRCHLPFYRDTDWFDIVDTSTTPHHHSYYLIGPQRTLKLDGGSKVIHEANYQSFQLTRADVQLYLEFFCSNLITDQGRFLVVESVDEIEWLEPPEQSFLADIRRHIRSPRIQAIDSDSNSGWLVEAEILHNDDLFTTSFKIDGGNGETTMVEDLLIASDLPVIPDLERLKYIGRFESDGKFLPLNLKEKPT